MKLHNTLGNQSQDLVPLNNNKVTLYSCGLTVYSQPHIGNWVAYIYWDLLQRALTANGYDVERVQNITDVGHLTDDGDAGEDKMQKGALKEGKTAWDVAEKYIAIADHEAYDLLGLIRPTHMPRATDYIEQQIDFVKQLESKGFTYTIADGVYFDTSKFPSYGKMARLDIEGLEFGARVADTGKKNPTDFALWKFSPKEEKRDMEWNSPWGVGFPGWHLECSVMAREILGDQIDIHSGGIDHIPVHHTNEIAQTESVTGKQFSQFWVHANHIKVDGQKMSKSLGNIITLQDILDKGYSLDAFKLLVLSKHYRTEGNFTWGILDAAQNRLRNWKAVGALLWQIKSAPEDGNVGPLLEPFSAYKATQLNWLLTDLDTPALLSEIDAILELIKVNGIYESTKQVIDGYFDFIQQITGIDVRTEDISEAQKRLIKDREAARVSSDWDRSDELRNELAQQGVSLRDEAFGTQWYRI